MMRQPALTVLIPIVIFSSFGVADAGVVFTASPATQTVLEDSRSGDILFSIANSKTINVDGNFYTVPIQTSTIFFNSFEWVGGDPAKDDIPVNPRWRRFAGTEHPFQKDNGIGAVFPTGPDKPIPFADFIFDTLPKHFEEPSDFDTWTMQFDLIIDFPNDLVQLGSNDTSTWKGTEFLHVVAEITIVDTPEPSTLVMSSILLGMFGVVWSYKRLKETTTT